MTKTELLRRITDEKERRGIKILAHTYQIPAILDLADVTGDSFALSKAATTLDCDTVVVCGVRFMAETVKILSPEKRVILAAPQATCPMAEQIPPERVARFREQNPDVAVCAYINTTAALKTQANVCVTSSSAVKICGNLDSEKILFIPDKNLGAFVAAAVPDKQFITWDGCCPVHDSLTADDVLAAKAEHPNALFAVHPEAPAEVVALADYVGATSGIIDFCINGTDREVIIGTECGVWENLTEKYPDRRFYQLAPKKLTCRDMKYTDLEVLLAAVTGEGGEEIILDEATRLAAKHSIDEMLRCGN